jgi:uroporphyrinogen-III synthase
MADALPLAGLRVLVTRPKQPGAKLARLIAHYGGQPVMLPLVDIVPCWQQATNQALISQLTSYRWVIAVSAYAAQYGALAIKQHWPSLPAGIGWLAVGAKTAKVLATLGVTVDYPQQQSSEGLLTLPQLQQVSQQALLILRGQGGRELLAQELKARGARVDYAELYGRRKVNYSPDYLADQLVPRQRVISLATSCLNLDYLDQLIAPLAERWQQLRQQPLLVVSDRIGKRASALGWQDIRLVAGADDQTILDGLLDL